MSVVCCKHKSQQRRSNIDEKFVCFKNYGAKNLIKKLLNKGWGLWSVETKQTFEKICKKLARYQDEAAALKAYRISLVFLFCDIHKQSGYYQKRMRHLFANFLSCNITEYYYNRSTFDRVITKIKRGNVFEARCKVMIAWFSNLLRLISISQPEINAFIKIDFLAFCANIQDLSSYCAYATSYPT